MQDTQQFIDFVRRSPTAFHAAESLCELLTAAGYTRLQECDAWTIVPGGRYFVTRNRSAVIAFAVPADETRTFRISAAHSDSPMFKLKPFTEETVLGHYLRLNAERYGGQILSTWFDRPLSIAGRAVVREGGRLTTKLVNLDRDSALIPNQAIHFCRDINDGYKFNAQVDTLPIYGCETASLKRDIAEAAGAAEEDVVASELFVYNRMPGSVWGDGAFFSCPRIDDLECAWGCMQGLLQSEAKGAMNVCAVFDNEEVGNESKQGAAATFLNDVLTRACLALGIAPAQIRAMMSAGFMVSADNAHAVHPNHPEKYDADNRCYMNCGVVIKHSAAQRYTTDAVSDAVFTEICRKAGVPVQHFANRSDQPGGGTLGNASNTKVSMNTVDIGLAQLAMHSSYETAGVKDLGYLTEAIRTFYETEIRVTADGEITIG